jgi:membrane-bound metal-dependent hydrolase YbcI (DUF457 family)
MPEMPLPIGHSLAGYLTYLGVEKDVTLHRWKIILLYLFCANLPDLDILPGFLMGLPNRYHHGISHSLGFAILAGMVVILYKRWRGDGHLLRSLSIASGLYFTHVLLDCLIVDTSFPYGVQLLWPLSSQYVISPVLIFPTVYKADTSGAFLGSLFQLGNLKLIGVELLYFLPLVGVAHLILRRRQDRP